jgi:ATP-binding protein involved in chromosome partitioning
VSRIRTYHELTEPDRSGVGAQVAAQRSRVAARLAAVRHVVAVASGKGGVGKSFVTAGLAAALARVGRSVGVLDADLQAPTAARMLGVSGGRLEVRDDCVVPPATGEGIRVISSDLLLPEGAALAWKEPPHERFVWRGTLEAGMLREFLGDVAWGELDVLLVDLPPGTDRLGALLELAPSAAGVVLVTIPSDASLRAVRRALAATREAGAPVLGILENMAGLFHGEAGATLAREADAPLLGRVPFDSTAQAAADTGRPATDGAAGTVLREASGALLERLARPSPLTPHGAPLTSHPLS